jgi:ATP-binding cassette subfamily F protein 3
MESTQSLVEAIEAFDGAVLIVTHLEMLLHATAKRLIIFDNDEIRVFEGTYQDFLDRVGWTGEEELRQEEKPTVEAGAASPNRKELRRKRAALITERSKKLGSLEKQIARLEETIMELEDRVERETGELLEASGEGDGARIKGLSKSLHEGREKIDTLFDQLERLTGEYETQAKDFEEKLSS